MFARHRQSVLLQVTSPSLGNWRPRAAAPHNKLKMFTDSAILEKYRYRRRLPHLQKADADLFVTFCTGARRVLPEKARDIVLEHCLREAGVARAPSPAKTSPKNLPSRIHLHAVVVMPDHVHILLKPLRDANGWPFPLVDILQCFKGATAHRIN